MSILHVLLIAPMGLALLWNVLVLASLAFPRRRWSLPGTWPRSVVMVPHYNEDPARLVSTLHGIEKQRYDGSLTVLLVDDGSTTGIQEVLNGWMAGPHRDAYRSIVLDSNTGSKGRALDRGLPYVDPATEVLVIVDSDTCLAEDALRLLVGRLWLNPRCAAACGYLLPAHGSRGVLARLQLYEYAGSLAATKMVEDRFGRVPIMAGAFMAHRFHAVVTLGGWGRWVVEDMAWTWRALAHGYETAYVSEALAFTSCPESRVDLFKQRRRWSRGRLEAYRETGNGSLAVRLLLMLLTAKHALVLSTCLLLPLTITTLAWDWRPVVMLSGGMAVVHAGIIAAHGRRTGNPGHLGIADVLVSSVTAYFFALFLWWPCLSGWVDELTGRNDRWLTRGLDAETSSHRSGHRGAGLSRSGQGKGRIR